MIKQQVIIECKKASGLFFALTICRVVIIIISVMLDVEFFRDFIRPMYTIIAWTIILIYIISDLYNELYFGKNKLILMLPCKSFYLWFAKYVAVGVNIIVFTVTGFIYELCTKYGIYHLQIIHSSQEPAINVAYYIASNIIGIMAGMSLLFVSISISKNVQNRVLSYFVAALLFFGVTIGWVLLVLYFSGALNDKYGWALGIASSVHVYNQYAGIIPVMIIPKKMSYDIAETISVYNLFCNIGTFFANMLLLNVITNNTKTDYVC